MRTTLVRWTLCILGCVGLFPGRSTAQVSSPAATEVPKAVDFSVPATAAQSAYLWTQLRDLPPALDTEAAKTFLETLRTDPAHLRALARLMREGPEAQRLAALRAAEWLEVRSILPVLVELSLQDRSDVLRASSAYAIRTLNRRSAPPVFENVLANGTTAQAIVAAEALGRIGDPASEPALRRALERALQRATVAPVDMAVAGNQRTAHPTVSRDAGGRRVVSFRGPQPPRANEATANLSTGLATSPETARLEQAVRTALESLGR